MMECFVGKAANNSLLDCADPDPENGTRRYKARRKTLQAVTYPRHDPDPGRDVDQPDDHHQQVDKAR